MKIIKVCRLLVLVILLTAFSKIVLLLSSSLKKNFTPLLSFNLAPLC